MATTAVDLLQSVLKSAKHAMEEIASVAVLLNGAKPTNPEAYGKAMSNPADAGCISRAYSAIDDMEFEVKLALAELQSPPAGKTIRIEIPVAINPAGKWYAAGSNVRGDEINLGEVAAVLGGMPTVVFVVADLPLPGAPAEVAGRVDTTPCG
jgi:hypothetical protein